MARNLLVVLLNEVSPSDLRSAVAEHGDGAPNVYVVAPMAVGPLHWLATDESEAREQASVRALEAEWILGPEAVGGEAGEADPTLAIEDALRRFAADEILLVGVARDDSLVASLRELGLPVSRAAAGPQAGGRGRVRTAVRGITSGRNAATPFVAFVGANLALLLLGLLITLVVVVIVWLAGGLAAPGL